MKGKFKQSISETIVSDHSWATDHWETIKRNYARAPSFNEYAPSIETQYQISGCETSLSLINYQFIKLCCRILKIDTTISRSSDYQILEGKNSRLLSLCQQAGATEYLSGPAARGYLDEGMFRRKGVDVLWMDYSGYDEYKQLYPPFEHKVSIIDLILNTGKHAGKYMKSGNNKR